MSEERLSLTLDARRTAIVVIDLQKSIVRMPGAPSPRPTVVANARADDFCSEDGSPRPAAGRAPDGTSPTRIVPAGVLSESEARCEGKLPHQADLASVDSGSAVDLGGKASGGVVPHGHAATHSTSYLGSAVSFRRPGGRLRSSRLEVGPL